MRVQWGSGDRQQCLAERFVLGGMRMDEPGNLGGFDAEVVQQLAFADQFPDPVADHVHTENLSGRRGHDLHRPGGLQDLAFAVAGEVVDQRRDVVAELSARRDLGEPDGGNLGV